jgi:hypothetical protein
MNSCIDALEKDLEIKRILNLLIQFENLLKMKFKYDVNKINFFNYFFGNKIIPLKGAVNNNSFYLQENLEKNKLKKFYKIYEDIIEKQCYDIDLSNHFLDFK